MAPPQFVSRSVMVYVFAIISVMMSARKYSVNAVANTYKQRPLIPIIADHDDEVDGYRNLEMDDAYDEQPDRSLLAGGELQVFLRAPQFEQPVAVEVSSEGELRDLRNEAARVLGVASNAVELRFQGQLIPTRDDNVPLADTGMSQGVEVEVSVARNDIDDLLRFLGADFVSAMLRASPDQEKASTLMQRIDELKRVAISSAADADSVDFSAVIREINDISADVLRLNYDGDEYYHQWPRIEKIRIYDAGMMTGRLQWQYLPPQTRELTVTLFSVTEMRLEDIECDNLEKLIINDSPNLSRLNLKGIEKCTSLQGLWIASNRALRELDLSPLADSAALQYVSLASNALTDDLNLSPLSHCPALKEVFILGNAFSAERAEEILDAFWRQRREL